MLREALHGPTGTGARHNDFCGEPCSRWLPTGAITDLSGSFSIVDGDTAVMGTISWPVGATGWGTCYDEGAVGVRGRETHVQLVSGGRSTMDGMEVVFWSDFETPVLVDTELPKDDCKNGGWRRFTNPVFRNQGQCVSYHNHLP